MIIFADKLSKLDFDLLSELYSDDIEDTRKRDYSRMDVYEGKLRAQQDYYQYLHDVFFKEIDGKIFVIKEEGRYICGVRLEPYKDGLLLNSLVTAADFRRKGYAAELLNHVLGCITDTSVYAHIHCRNIASLRLHEQLGFKLLCDYARMLDDSVCTDYNTYIKKI